MGRLGDCYSPRRPVPFADAIHPAIAMRAESVPPHKPKPAGFVLGAFLLWIAVGNGDALISCSALAHNFGHALCFRS